MGERCLKRNKHSRALTFMLPLALAAALLMTGCGKKTGTGDGGGPADGGNAGTQETAAVESKDSGENSGAESGVKESAADAGAGATGAQTAADKEKGKAADKDSAAGKTGAEPAAKADAGADKKKTAAAAKTGAESGTKSEAGTGKKETAAASKTGKKAGAESEAEAGKKETAAAAKTGKKASAESGKTSAAAAAAGKETPLTEKAGGGSVGEDKASGNTEEDKYADYSEFNSSKMGFSFRYDPANTPDTTDTGACEMIIGKEKKLTGLFVSSLSAEDMPEASQILKEEAEDVRQKYKNAMVQEPEKSSLTVDDHDLTGQTWAYSLPSGGTVECASYIEIRGGRCSFFKTEAMRGDTAPADDALKLAIRTLKFANDKTKKAASKTSSTEKAAAESKSEKEKKSKKDSSIKTVGIADLTDSTDEKESETETFGEAYSFDVDEKWLVVPKDTSTTVYTRGSMQGAYFVVDKIEMEEKPANYLSNRAEEIKQKLGDRLLNEPEVKTVELGERRLTGIEYEYVSADGARNLYQAEYIETTALGTFTWELACNQGDNESVAAMLSAMETFMPK